MESKTYRILSIQDRVELTSGSTLITAGFRARWCREGERVRTESALYIDSEHRLQYFSRQYYPRKRSMSAPGCKVRTMGLGLAGTHDVREDITLTSDLMRASKPPDLLSWTRNIEVKHWEPEPEYQLEIRHSTSTSTSQSGSIPYTGMSFRRELICEWNWSY